MIDYLEELEKRIRQQEHDKEMAELCGLYTDARFHAGYAHGLQIAAELMGKTILTESEMLLIETALEIYTGDGCPEPEEIRQELIALMVKLRHARQGEG